MLPECPEWGALPQVAVSSSPKEASRQRPLASAVREGIQAREVVPPPADITITCIVCEQDRFPGLASNSLQSQVQLGNGQF